MKFKKLVALLLCVITILNMLVVGVSAASNPTCTFSTSSKTVYMGDDFSMSGKVKGNGCTIKAVQISLFTDAKQEHGEGIWRADGSFDNVDLNDVVEFTWGDSVRALNGTWLDTSEPGTYWIQVYVSTEEGRSFSSDVKRKFTVKEEELDEYTVRYDANGGTGAPSTQYKTEGERLYLSEDEPTRSGYEFQGWATSKSGNVKYDPGDKYTTDSDITLYAVWEKVEEADYTIRTFDANKFSVAVGEKLTFTVTTGPDCEGIAFEVDGKYTIGEVTRPSSTSSGKNTYKYEYQFNALGAAEDRIVAAYPIYDGDVDYDSGDAISITVKEASYTLSSFSVNSSSGCVGESVTITWEKAQPGKSSTTVHYHVYVDDMYCGETTSTSYTISAATTEQLGAGQFGVMIIATADQHSQQQENSGLTLQEKAPEKADYAVRNLDANKSSVAVGEKLTFTVTTGPDCEGIAFEVDGKYTIGEVTRPSSTSGGKNTYKYEYQFNALGSVEDRIVAAYPIYDGDVDYDSGDAISITVKEASYTLSPFSVNSASGYVGESVKITWGKSQPDKSSTTVHYHVYVDDMYCGETTSTSYTLNAATTKQLGAGQFGVMIIATADQHSQLESYSGLTLDEKAPQKTDYAIRTFDANKDSVKVGEKITFTVTTGPDCEGIAFEVDLAYDIGEVTRPSSTSGGKNTYKYEYQFNSVGTTDERIVAAYPMYDGKADYNDGNALFIIVEDASYTLSSFSVNSVSGNVGESVKITWGKSQPSKSSTTVHYHVYVGDIYCGETTSTSYTINAAITEQLGAGQFGVMVIATADQHSQKQSNGVLTLSGNATEKADYAIRRFESNKNSVKTGENVVFTVTAGADCEGVVFWVDGKYKLDTITTPTSTSKTQKTFKYTYQFNTSNDAPRIVDVYPIYNGVADTDNGKTLSVTVKEATYKFGSFYVNNASGTAGESVTITWSKAQPGKNSAAVEYTVYVDNQLCGTVTGTSYTLDANATSELGAGQYGVMVIATAEQHEQKQANGTLKLKDVDKYSIRYNANGGSGAPADQSKRKGESLKLSADIPNRSGYTFKGWSTSTNGSVQYIKGAYYTEDKSITLYAVWEKNKEGATENELPYTDVAKSFWGYDAIKFVTEEGIIDGKSSTKFEPNAHMTRGDFVTALARLSNVTGDPVAWAEYNGVMEGYSDGFRLTSTVTRDQMAVFIHRYINVDNWYFGEPDKTYNYFADHNNIKDWAETSIYFMRQISVISGRNNNKFEPQALTTRAEAATVLYNLVNAYESINGCRHQCVPSDEPIRNSGNWVDNGNGTHSRISVMYSRTCTRCRKSVSATPVSDNITQSHNFNSDPYVCSVCGYTKAKPAETFEMWYRFDNGTDQRAGNTITVDRTKVNKLVLWATSGQTWAQPDSNSRFRFEVIGSSDVLNLAPHGFSGIVGKAGTVTVNLWDDDENSIIGSITVQVIDSTAVVTQNCEYKVFLTKYSEVDASSSSEYVYDGEAITLLSTQHTTYFSLTIYSQDGTACSALSTKPWMPKDGALYWKITNISGQSSIDSSGYVTSSMRGQSKQPNSQFILTLTEYDGNDWQQKLSFTVNVDRTTPIGQRYAVTNVRIERGGTRFTNYRSIYDVVVDTSSNWGISSISFEFDVYDRMLNETFTITSVGTTKGSSNTLYNIYNFEADNDGTYMNSATALMSEGSHSLKIYINGVMVKELRIYVVDRSNLWKPDLNVLDVGFNDYGKVYLCISNKSFLDSEYYDYKQYVFVCYGTDYDGSLDYEIINYKVSEGLLGLLGNYGEYAIELKQKPQYLIPYYYTEYGEIVDGGEIIILDSTRPVTDNFLEELLWALVDTSVDFAYGVGGFLWDTSEGDITGVLTHVSDIMSLESKVIEDIIVTGLLVNTLNLSLTDAETIYGVAEIVQAVKNGFDEDGLAQCSLIFQVPTKAANILLPNLQKSEWKNEVDLYVDLIFSESTYTKGYADITKTIVKYTVNKIIDDAN